MPYFINHTNHPSQLWNEEQRKAAESEGEIIDYPFPAIDPYADKEEIIALAAHVADDISHKFPAVVLCQGEFNYTYAMVSELKKRNITVVAAASERIVTEASTPDGETQKVSLFRFVRFREY